MQSSVEKAQGPVESRVSFPDAVMYRLDPEKPDESMSFLVGDENVIFFLDKSGQLLTGDSNFSYTLNKVDDD